MRKIKRFIEKILLYLLKKLNMAYNRDEQKDRLLKVLTDCLGDYNNIIAFQILEDGVINNVIPIEIETRDGHKENKYFDFIRLIRIAIGINGTRIIFTIERINDLGTDASVSFEIQLNQNPLPVVSEIISYSFNNKEALKTDFIQQFQHIYNHNINSLKTPY